MLAKIFLLKVTKAVHLYIDTYEQDMIEFGKENKKIKTQTDGIIVIIFPCNHCWELIIVHPYFIRLKVLFG